MAIVKVIGPPSGVKALIQNRLEEHQVSHQVVDDAFAALHENCSSQGLSVSRWATSNLSLSTVAKVRQVSL